MTLIYLRFFSRLRNRSVAVVSATPGTRDPKELLRGLGLIKDGVLLRAAVVLFGKTERVEVEMLHCLLRVARFRGINRLEFLDNRQFRDNAFGLLLRAERFMRENLPVAGRIVPNLFERVDEPLYPPEALREALANAFCHRDIVRSAAGRWPWPFTMIAWR